MKVNFLICFVVILICSSVLSARTVQWNITEGGNGHFYEIISIPGGIVWIDANELAQQMGGYLVTITSQAENDFIYSLVNDEQYWNGSCGPLLGGYQIPGAAEPNEEWKWVTGEPMTYTNWSSDQPNNKGGNENCIHFGWVEGTKSTWNDLENQYTIQPAVAFIIEYSERVIYVDDSAMGNNDGSNWDNAYVFLQDALRVSSYGDEIWVAQGLYKPDQGRDMIPGDRTVSFSLKNGVYIKGGYAGVGATDPNLRNTIEFKTTLSGDLDQNDIQIGDLITFANEPTLSDNSYHVVWGNHGWDELSPTDHTAIIEGFTITAGNANGDWRHGYFGGGGMCNWYGSPTVRDCHFVKNVGGNGGGMRNARAGTTVINCTFTDNVTIREWGAGIVNISCYDITISGCLLVGNYSASEGGGVYCEDSAVKVINATFYGNTAFNTGGGIFNVSSDSIVANSILWANSDAGGNTLTAQINTDDISYSCIQGLIGRSRGNTNIGDPPLFASPESRDFHLRSEAGRYDPQLLMWVEDNVTSPCIDAGDPNSSIDLEPFPNGDRINQGSFGGTDQASMSVM